MRTTIAAAAIAASFAATSAGAQTATYSGGVGTPSTGFTVINTFDDTSGLTGSNFQIQVPPSNSTGAPPANSSPAGTAYLSVLGNGSATYSLASFLPRAIQFDWGSLDSYNTLTIGTVLGNSFSYVPGSTGFPGFPFFSDDDGNQVAADTNGRFTFSIEGVRSLRNDRISTVTFASSANSFEIDNFAISGGVPEPATWALMIMGFGAVGGALRRRTAATAAFA